MVKSMVRCDVQAAASCKQLNGWWPVEEVETITIPGKPKRLMTPNDETYQIMCLECQKLQDAVVADVKAKRVKPV